jgi:hypothetical protein
MVHFSQLQKKWNFKNIEIWMERKSINIEIVCFTVVIELKITDLETN